MKRFVVLGAMFTAVMLLSGAAAYAYVPEGKSKEAAKGGPSLKRIKPEGEPREIIFKLKPAYRENSGSVAALLRADPGKVQMVYRPESVIKKYMKKNNIKIRTDGSCPFMGKTYKREESKGLDKAIFSEASKDPEFEFFCSTYKVKLPLGMSAGEAISLIKNKMGDRIVYIEPNAVVTAQMVPHDPLYPQQWSHQNMRSELAWDPLYSGQNVTIAIIDTGVDYNHEDLAANMWHNPGEIGIDGEGHDKSTNNNDDDGNGYIDDVYGYDFYNNDADPKDDFGHGTHCAGIVGAVINNSPVPLGIAGVCPTAKIMAIKFLSITGAGSLDGGVNSIVYAADNGAKVISNSWGASGTYASLQEAVDYAYGKGCFVVAAAGNYATQNIGSPANCQNAFAVGAIDSNSAKAGFSNFGPKVDVAAPGAGIISTMPQYHVTMNDWGYGLNYASMSGTSMACPQVAGQAALILSRYPYYSPYRIANMIRSGAVADIVSDQYVGTGRVDLYNTFSNDKASFDMMAARITSPEYYEPVYPSSAPVSGTAKGRRYTLAYANMPYSKEWIVFAQKQGQVSDGLLGEIPASRLDTGLYFVKLTVTDPGGAILSHETRFFMDKQILPGWPQQIDAAGGYPNIDMSPACADFDNDGRKELLAWQVANFNHRGVKAYLWSFDGKLIPGWPKTIMGATPPDSGYPSNGKFYTTPAVRDLDGDRDLEVVFPIPEGGVTVMHAWHHDGSYLSGWPVIIDPAGRGSNPCYPRNAAIGDINGDGQPEVVVTVQWMENSQSEYHTFEAYAFNKNGQLLSGWPVSYDHIKDYSGSWLVNNLSDPALADINNDGCDDIIFAYSDGDFICVTTALDGRTAAVLAGWPSHIRHVAGNTLKGITDPGGGGDGPPIRKPWSNAPKGIAVRDVNNDGNKEVFFITGQLGIICGMDKDGNDLPGWPKDVAGGGVRSSLSLADMDNDGDLEILAHERADGGRFYIYHHDGSLLAEWNEGDPVSMEGNIIDIMPFYADPVIGDIDGDAAQEIVITTYFGHILKAFDVTGNIKPGFPKQLSWPGEKWYVQCTPTLADLDNDGKTELIIGDSQGKVYAWRFGNADPAMVQWPMYGINLGRTYFNPLLPLAVSVSPNPGYPTQEFTISGHYFGARSPNSSVELNFRGYGMNAQATSWNDSMIKFLIPISNLPQEGTYSATVVTPRGRSNTLNFTLIRPVINSLSLVSGKANTDVTITGTNFGATQGSGTVKFGSTTAAVVPGGWSNISITCKVPAIASGQTYQVTVTIAGCVSNPKNFRVTR